MTLKTQLDERGQERAMTDELRGNALPMGEQAKALV